EPRRHPRTGCKRGARVGHRRSRHVDRYRAAPPPERRKRRRSPGRLEQSRRDTRRDRERHVSDRLAQGRGGADRARQPATLIPIVVDTVVTAAVDSHATQTVSPDAARPGDADGAALDALLDALGRLEDAIAREAAALAAADTAPLLDAVDDKRRA